MSKWAETHYENLFERNVNFKERVVYISDEIAEQTLELFQKALDELDKYPDKPIRVEISSYGGSVYDMLGIIDRIKASPCHIITRGFGKIMSAATLIFAAGDERLLGRNSAFMIHEMSDIIEGKFSSLKVDLKETERLEKQAQRLYEEFSKGKTKAKTFEKLMTKDCYLTSEEVVKLGLADGII